MAYPYYQQPYQYQPYYMPQPNQQPAQQNRETGFALVQGDAAMKSYLVAPGATMFLLDLENKRLCVKSADMSGMPTMRDFDITERKDQTAASYVTRDEFEKFKASLEVKANDAQ